MKAVLEFDLPTDLEEYKLHFEGPKYAIMWDNLDIWLREQKVYEITRNEITIDELREKMNEIKNEVMSDL